MAHGKSVILYLMDGTSEGRIRCKLSSWNAIAYKIPRTMLKESKDLDRIDSPGVYFLFGQDDNSDRPFAYVGEGDNSIQRVMQGHTFEKDGTYWTEAIIFVTQDNTLEKGRIKYLENRFYEIMKEADRYEVKNGNNPPRSPVDEAVQDMLEDFILNAKLVMPNLGYHLFDEIPSKKNDDNLLYFSRKSGKGGQATGRLASDGFWVLRGSYINPELAKSVPSGIRRLRKEYAELIDKNGVLIRDIRFGSPSYAASFVCGKSSNGLLEWKNSKGVSLKQLDAVEEERPERKMSAKDNAGIELYLVGKMKATAVLKGSDFIVLKDSEFCMTERPSCSKSIHDHREKLFSENKVKDGKLLVDVIFSSPSMAAACLRGVSANGLISWKDADGRLLREIKRASEA